MTPEEKELLLKDLSARLPYGVIVYSLQIPYEQKLIGYIPDIEKYSIKPYLRPMSSMTEEEENELTGIAVLGGYNSSVFNSFIVIDWLNAHHFDYRGLIEKGLALEAPKGMYKNF